jgi:glutaredoxin 2
MATIQRLTLKLEMRKKEETATASTGLNIDVSTEDIYIIRLLRNFTL